VLAETTLADIRAKVARIAPSRAVSIYYGRGKDGLTTAGAGSLEDEFIEILGQRNVAREPLGMFRATAAQLADWNPDLVVLLGRDTAKAFRGDPQLAALRAVRDRRVLAAPTLPFGWLDGPPSPSRLIGLQWLGQLLFPDIFTADLRAATRGFYRDFYGVELSDAQLDELLAD